MISRGDTVKGFEYAKDQYVVITDEDLASVPLKTVRSHRDREVRPRRAGRGRAVRFVKQAYYVEPEPIGRKAYALLREVLAEQGLAAICKVVIKDREALAALNPHGDAMVLETLHWPDEIRAIEELDLPASDVEIKPAERAMAAQLIAAMTGAFDPTEYRDEYRPALEQVIEAKVEGREIAEPARRRRRGPAGGPDGRSRGERECRPDGAREPRGRGGRRRGSRGIEAGGRCGRSPARRGAAGDEEEAGRAGSTRSGSGDEPARKLARRKRPDAGPAARPRRRDTERRPGAMALGRRRPTIASHDPRPRRRAAPARVRAGAPPACRSGSGRCARPTAKVRSTTRATSSSRGGRGSARSCWSRRRVRLRAEALTDPLPSFPSWPGCRRCSARTASSSTRR